MNLIDLKKAKDEAISKAIKDHKVFFAFSNEQFEESKTELQPNEKYVRLQGGGFIPELQFNSFIKEMVKVQDNFKKAVEENNLKEKHIIYELQNYECFYTMDPTKAINTLSDFYSEKEILEVFSKCVKSGEYND